MSDTDDSEFWAAEIAKQEEPYRNYWQALGKFIDQFAAVEQEMQNLLRHYADTSDEVGRVVFSGHKIKDGADTVNRLLDARNLPRPKARLKPVFSQLGEINTTRNNIVHWGVVHDPLVGIAAISPGVTVTNRHLVQPGRTEQRYLVTLTDFADMTTDLLKISIHMQIEMLGAQISRPLYRKAIRAALRSAWSYRPPQRAAQPRRSPGKLPKQKPPPRSSGGSDQE